MGSIKVKVTRAICIKGKRIEVDKVIEIENTLANELSAAGKVTFDTKAPNQKTKAELEAEAKLKAEAEAKEKAEAAAAQAEAEAEADKLAAEALAQQQSTAN